MFGKKHEEEHNIWMSFSDLFSGFMVIFIVVSLMLFNRDPVKNKYSEMSKDFTNKFHDIQEIQIPDDEATIRFKFDENSPTPLFISGKSEPTPYFQSLLNKFIPIFYSEIKKLHNDTTKFKIKELRIEGHTDNISSYIYNLNLSSNRALEVQKYILNSPFVRDSLDNVVKAFIERNSISCGYSYARSLDGDGNFTTKSGKPISPEKSRRVEFRILLENKK